MASFCGNFAPPGSYFFARSERPPPRRRRDGSLSKRSSLARLDFVLRILPWRQRRGVRRQPSDGLDRPRRQTPRAKRRDRKSTRLNSSHTVISYAVFCLKKKKKS